MKLAGAAANAYLRRPDPSHAALLIFGADPMRVAGKRQQAITALIGPEGEAEMRLTRINAADLRKDPAALDDAIKAQGFFAGHRVAFVEDATDALAPLLDAALKEWRTGDAQLVVTAAALTAKSALRKVFEPRQNAMAIGIYDDPPSPADITDALARAGLPPPPRDVMDAMMALAATLEPGDMRQTLDKLGLYKLDDPTPVTLADLAAVAPQSAEVDLDDVLDVVSHGNSAALGPALGALYAQGVTPVTLCIGAMRHFRRLHVVAADPGGVAAGMNRLRPPVFGQRRDKIQRQASQWGMRRLEMALTLLTDTDLQLRSANTAPQNALMERALIRLAMMAGR